MRKSVLCASLIAFAALSAPQNAVSQEPAGMIVPAAATTDTARWTTRAHGNRMPTRPGVVVPTIEVAREAPPNVVVSRIGSSEITTEIDGEIQAAPEEGTFLVPTWDRGFWVMPPGGLTRFLFPAPGFINPEMCHLSP